MNLVTVSLSFSVSEFFRLKQYIQYILITSCFLFALSGLQECMYPDKNF